MFGNLSLAEIEDVLSNQLVGRIGCHDDGTTYVVPISYAYDGTDIYCHTHEGMKINIMRKNSRVCFEVDNVGDTANWKSVIAWGEYEELESESRERALRFLLDRKLPILSSETTHLSPVWPFIPDKLNDIDGVVFRIRLNKKTGRFEKQAGNR